MSETEDLKKGVEESRARQQFEAINNYLDTLSANIDETSRHHKWSSRLYMAAWLAWVIAAWLPDNLHYLFTMIFLMTLIYDQFRFCRMMRAYGEFRGCIETLRLLGMIPPVGGDRERKKRTWKEGLDIVKGWMTQKKKMQDTAYAPA